MTRAYGYIITAFGEERSAVEWSRISGIPSRALINRIQGGMCSELALSLPSWSRPDLSAAPGAPLSWTWDALEYEHDQWAQDFVRRHPKGGTLDQVAASLGITRERTRQLEEQALAKLRHAGVCAHALLEQRGRGLDDDGDTEGEYAVNAIDAVIGPVLRVQAVRRPAARAPAQQPKFRASVATRHKQMELPMAGSKVRPSNSFTEEEVALGKAMLTKISMHRDFAAFARHPDFGRLFGKFQAMDQRVQEASAPAEEERGAA